ncbi:MAG: nitrogenase [Treponema sp.]|uniref:nitrogenase component 1 n=1 Tax=Treponema sp. TaxID=166 RepID=UPI0025F03C68|nr:nitrogenase component 1 [Treponema sp.]MBQ8679715.1 nitrogenase [Treponema sp.]
MKGLQKRVEIREKRLQTILTYQGDAKQLVEGSEKNTLKIGKLKFSQCSNCQEGCALMQIYSILDAAVVSHSPIGCYAAISTRFLGNNVVSKMRGNRPFLHHGICTNIQESDTIYGGINKLRQTVQEAYNRYNPKIVYITTSCASGIIGDDVQALAEEMTEELGIPVFAVECEGFKSRVWSTGFDASFNGVLNAAVKPPKKKQSDLVNIFNFNGIDSFSPLLKTIGLRPNYLIETRTVEELSEMSEAACSSTICETLATFISDKLEELYGVPQVKAPSPYGLQWTDRWLRAVAALTGKQSIVEAAIRSEHARIEPELNELREFFKGKKAYVFAGDAFAHNLASVAHDLGLEVIGITTYHHDKKYDNPEVNTAKFMIQAIGNVPNVSVCNKQPYQVVKLLKKLKPDFLLVRHPGLAVLGFKLGIPAIMENDSDKAVGYEGILDLGRRIKRAMIGAKLYKNFAKHTEFPYSDWWLDDSTDPFYFVEK